MKKRRKDTFFGESRMRKIDTLLLDLDGTLVDSRAHILACMNFALSHIGEDQVDFETVREILEPTLEDTFRAVLEESKWFAIDQCVNLYRKYQEQHLDKSLRKIELYPSVGETLTKLSKYNLAVVTGKPTWLAERILLAKSVRQHFLTIVGADQVRKVKPSPDAVYLALSRIGYFHTALLVGDSVPDIESGRNANVLTCAVEYGYTERKKLLQAKPDFLIGDFRELIAILSDF